MQIGKWIRLLYIRLLLRKTEYVFLPSSLKGHYPVCTKDFFYKFALKNREFFLYEKSIVKFLTEYPELKACISEYAYGFFHYKAELLDTISDEAECFSAAKEILTVLKKYGKKEKIMIQELPFVKDGICIIGLLFGEEIRNMCQIKAECILSQQVFRIGFCHGDFHDKNIMKKKGQPVMIDLDCFRKRSIQEFDAIYFVLQSYVDYTVVPTWFDGVDLFEEKIQRPLLKDFLNDFVEPSILSDLFFLFFLDRIGQDYKYEKRTDVFPSEKIRNNLEYFNVSV